MSTTHPPPYGRERNRNVPPPPPAPVFVGASRRPPQSGQYLTYGRPRKKRSADRCRCPHRQGQCSCRPHSYSTPAVLRRWPVSVVLALCGRACRPACAPTAASVCMELPAPFLRRVPALARSPQLRVTMARSHLWTLCPEVGSLRCFPSRGIPFRTVILFSRCCPPMNYSKCRPF